MDILSIKYYDQKMNLKFKSIEIAFLYFAGILVKHAIELLPARHLS
jgi:hypothetical protein